MSDLLFSAIIDALVKDGYAIIPDALDSQLASNLQKMAQEQTHFKQAGISSSPQVHTDTLRRRDKISWLNEDSSFQSQYLDFINKLQEQLNKELYLGIKYYEGHFSIYNEGDFYEKHLDAFKGSKNRIVSTVYYLNQEWDKKDAGELLIYNDKDSLISTVIPNANTLVVFLSDTFPHEVKPANRKRYSIAGWFRID